ncbi:MAG: flagellar basal body L-ring protein FlgH [Sedimentisphaerales bacterium]|jgi:flagellar L-ring protein precursor FlgH|nr:flagellar basal body L-ring protein FlgH [Sedimentisphaerales bacterium]
MASRQILIGILVITSLTGQVYAGSLWAKRNKDARSPYTDDVARHIGDVLTIRISEGSKIDNKAKRDLQKQTSLSSDFDGKLGISTAHHKIIPDMPGFTMDAQASNDLQSKADYKDERKYVDSITVVVVDILPNRNLVVHGTRDRDIAGDIQTIEVSGIVRPSDISFDNTVRSEQVANFRLTMRNKGTSAAYQQPGWLGQIFNALWPF